MTTAVGVLEEAREAFARHAWDDAYEGFAAGDVAGALQGDDLERLATAAHLSGHDEESTDAWARAHSSLLADGETERAVRCLFWLAMGLFQRGAMAQGGGWIARAWRIVEEHRLDCVERGYLLLPEALTRMAGGDQLGALGPLDDAADLAQRFADDDLAALVCIGRGQALLHAGRIVEGTSCFDEAMVAVTAGELSAPVAGMVYCAVIDECQQVFDVRRAQEWTAALTRWCEAQPALVPYRGQCLVHRSQVMQLNGAWRDALAEAQRARSRLSEPAHPALGMAHYQLGELHRLRGEVDDAEVAYRQAHELGRSPQPGLALLRLAQGHIETAVSAVDAALAEAGDDVERAMVLPAYVEITLAADRVEDARVAAAELAHIASGAHMPYLLAAAAHWHGAVLLADGEPRSALERLREAWRAWEELQAPYETARARVLIARAHRSLGDDETAELEEAAARRSFEQLGAPSRPLLGGTPTGATTADSSPRVTSREVEVLRLVAAGRTNRQIAEELVISGKTVERHLSNIFTKLGVSNRAAATAAAYDLHLV